jgi:Uma2 family endonuclease
MHVASTSAHLARSPGGATVEEWLAIPEKERAELIHGRIVYDAFPGPKHGFTQGGVFALLWPYNRRGGGHGGGGGDKPGGWWISQEVDMVLGGIGCRPDVVGWRRDKHARVPQPDERGVVTTVPDFICEVLSSSTARYDQGPKRDAYFQAGVQHYWLVDPTYETLTVLERADRGYVIVLVAGPGEAVRAVPFDRVEIPVEELFLEEEGGSGSLEPEGEPKAGV